MGDYTVQKLATLCKLSVDDLKLLIQKKTGQDFSGKSPDDEVSPEVLAAILKSATKKKTLSLGKKKTSSGSGVTVTIKKKARTVVRPTPTVPEASQPVVAAPLPKVSEAHQTLTSQASVVAEAEVTTTTDMPKAQDKSEKRKIKTPSKPSKETSQIDDLKRKKRKGHFYDDSTKNRHKEIPLKERGGHRSSKASAQTVLAEHRFEKPTKSVVREVAIPEVICVADLAHAAAVQVKDVLTMLAKEGMMVKRNDNIEQDVAALVVEMLGHTPVLKKEENIEQDLLSEASIRYEGQPSPRAPVVTFMGHVDHGKTTLIDYIRRTRITAGEAGGITQHIGAYTVATKTGGKITFLDTPGHAAFTEMRARGVQCTDIVVLVVAADDGVMPQTLEAIEHAKAANVPIVVAVNKIDKPEADLDRVRTELSNRGVVCESWGGDTIFQPVSAKVGTGMDDLLESILLQAEVLELSAHAEGMAMGVVIEAQLDKGRGPVATVMVQSGALQKGDIMLAGKEFGRVRAMVDGAGQATTSAGPSEPVEVLGLSGVPEAGDPVMVVDSERKAREIALHRQGSYRDKRLASSKIPTFSDVLIKAKLGELKEINLILKADTHGSVGAASQALQGLSNDEVKVNIVSAQVGGITESDLNLAIASGAMILGFNVRADATVRKRSDQEQVEIAYYSVIYDMIDAIKLLVKGLVAPKFEDKIIGQLLVKEVFRSSKFGLVAGCLVTEGSIKQEARLKLLRDSIVLHDGDIASLRHYRDQVREVKSGSECGVGLKDFTDIRAGDHLEVYIKEQIVVRD